ncbi:hypothetical protein GGS23DRAFT_594511 [Durotheca rogersii]|uniref:uncharacterized protein n=1 Tax=Durotheca rogersii TaxID=419775 RepID=UPI00221F0C4A|nr:uncharacterized protein GGS23DRAFT_594511 [Durotheca rogersii]KAI5866394.1 hypothetical protein GGS23DRAFT_594511 [Durotheca rogersii]
MPHADGNQPGADGGKVRIAIIGGGIVGVVTALGLLKRDMDVQLYEQARSFREIGPGLTFSANAQRCMEMLDPNVLAAMKAVSTKNESLYYNYVDGYHRASDDPSDMREEQLFQLFAGETGFDACHRAHFLDELTKFVPPGIVQFQKRLDTADVVIGCDGIRSRVRELLLGKDNPASSPRYAHQVAFRGLIQMDKAVAALGHDKAHNQCMHMGPRGHVLNFPVAQHTLMNVVVFADDDDEWRHEKLTAPASKDEVVRHFRDWGPAVRAIAGLLDDNLDKWAIFDTYEHPAPAIATLRVASTTSKDTVLSAALSAYDTARHERGQWLVRSSREVSRTYEWANPDCGSDPVKCLKGIERRAHKIWYLDIEGMLRDVREEYDRLVLASGRS